MQCPWSVIDYFDDVDDKLAMFQKIYINAWNLVAPIKQRRVRRKKSLWMTEEILNSLHRRDTLYKSLIYMCKTDTWMQNKTFRNRCSYLIPQAKRSFFLNPEVCQKQPKKFWSLLKAESGFSKKKLSDLAWPTRSTNQSRYIANKLNDNFVIIIIIIKHFLIYKLLTSPVN